MIADSQLVKRLTDCEQVVYIRLAARAGVVVKYDEFTEVGITNNSRTHNVANFVHSIRCKFPEVQIYNVHGVGYILRRKNGH
jgi:DNA-binding response OmpR family regulator